MFRRPPCRSMDGVRYACPQPAENCKGFFFSNLDNQQPNSATGRLDSGLAEMASYFAYIKERLVRELCRLRRQSHRSDSSPAISNFGRGFISPRAQW